MLVAEPIETLTDVLQLKDVGVIRSYLSSESPIRQITELRGKDKGKRKKKKKKKKRKRLVYGYCHL